MGKLTAKTRGEMLAEYAAGTPVRAILKQFGVVLSTLMYHLDRAAVPRRQRRPRLTEEQRAARDARAGKRRPVELPFEQSPLLPVYPVRLVSRPGVKPPSLRDLLPPRCSSLSPRAAEQCALPEGHDGPHHNEACSSVWGFGV